MNKTIYFGNDATKQLLGGAELVYSSVKATAGPLGRNAVIEREYGPPHITHDGVTVAKAVEAPIGSGNHYKAGVELLKEASTNMNNKVGNGTTAVVILAYHILNEAYKLMAAGHNPMTIQRNLNMAADEVLRNLPSISTKIEGLEDLTDVVILAARGDTKTGTLVAQVMHEIGADGTVTVEETGELETTSNISDGYSMDGGYYNPYMISDSVKMEAAFDNPAILVTKDKLDNPSELMPIMRKLSEHNQKNMLIIAAGISEDVLEFIVSNKNSGAFNAVVSCPLAHGDRRVDVLNDIALLTGTNVLGRDMEHTLETVADDPSKLLGSAKKTIATKQQTSIVGARTTGKDLNKYIKEVRAKLAEAKTEHDKEYIKNRVSTLTGKAAVIKVGGATTVEVEELKDRIDDAIASARAALTDGVVPGAGVTFITLSKYAEQSPVLKEALLYPARIVMENAGVNADHWLPKIEEEPGYGIDVSSPTGLYELKSRGIIDPTKVIEESIRGAVSIAGNAMTAGTLIALDGEE